jgi:hypothetical protein
MMTSRFDTYSSRFATTVDVEVPEIVINILTDPESLSKSYHCSFVNSLSNVDRLIEHLKFEVFMV